ncbi:MAG: carbamoyltransferase [Proteobacteria bacterium]|nr:carbamoyltransferase [Pseudomonadota bacterium]
MRILGISAFYHDSAAAILIDGKIRAAAQEERFTRRKHDSGFPEFAVNYCLDETGCTLGDIDHVVFYEKPFLKFERLLETYLAFAPRGFTSFRMAMPVWLREKLFQKDLLCKAFGALAPDVEIADRLLFSEHHVSHAASAFFPSPFDEAAILTMDGVGEWATMSMGVGHGSTLELQRELRFPHSLGLLYSAFTYYAGFKVNSGEYKLMGLAPYGEPRYAKLILDKLVDLKPDGSLWLDQSYFNYCTGLTMTNDRFADLFGQPVRKPDEQLTQFHMDIAASVQTVTEEIVVRLARSTRKETGLRNLCLAGGVALNCVANGRLLREGIFEDLWVQPAAGDAGGALGAALAAHHLHLRQPRTPRTSGMDSMHGSFLGPWYAQSEIERRLAAVGAKFEVLDEDTLIAAIARALADQQAVGWMSGRMEFGPRALGGRSILGDPRSPTMQKMLNLKVKYRESFRPFAPAVLGEDVANWFELDRASPYMLLVAPVKAERRRRMSAEEQALFGIDKLNVARSEIPAVTHVDYSSRVQTVHRETNPRFHALLTAFKRATGCPVLVNTSFNIRGEPIVNTPEDAFRCFMGSEIDVLSIGNCLLRKEFQPTSLALDYRNSVEPD